MGAGIATATVRQSPAQDELLVKVARMMWKKYGARAYLFGSRARGTHHPESDYDIVMVARAFDGQRRIYRARERYKLWYEAGGWGVGLDLHCYTPEEFREELAGLGYLGQAKRRGELMRVYLRGVT